MKIKNEILEKGISGWGQQRGETEASGGEYCCHRPGQPRNSRGGGLEIFMSFLEVRADLKMDKLKVPV